MGSKKLFAFFLFVALFFVQPPPLDPGLGYEILADDVSSGVVKELGRDFFTIENYSSFKTVSGIANIAEYRTLLNGSKVFGLEINIYVVDLRYPDGRKERLIYKFSWPQKR